MNAPGMYQDERLGKRRVPKNAVVSQIFKYTDQLPWTIYWPVSRPLGHSSLKWEMVQGCRERPRKPAQIVSEIGPRRWTGEQGSVAVVVAEEHPQGNHV